MVFKFTIIVLLVTSALVSCQKDQRLTTDTGFIVSKKDRIRVTPQLSMTGHLILLKCMNLLPTHWLYVTYSMG